MATFAKLDENNIVINISKVDDKNCLDENGDESEAVGIAYLQSIHGGGNYKQTLLIHTKVHTEPEKQLVEAIMLRSEEDMTKH